MHGCGTEDTRMIARLSAGIVALLVFVGMIVSAVTGCIVIRYFLKFLRRHTLRFFVAYRVIFGIMVIALALFRCPTG